MNQARVHDFFLNVMRKSPARLEPHYARRLLHLARAERQRVRSANSCELPYEKTRMFIGPHGLLLPLGQYSH